MLLDLLAGVVALASRAVAQDRGSAPLLLQERGLPFPQCALRLAATVAAPMTSHDKISIAPPMGAAIGNNRPPA